MPAIEPSEAYANACRPRVPGTAVRVGCADALPVEDGGFDAVVAELVIQALGDASAAAREVAAPGDVVDGRFRLDARARAVCGGA